MTGKLFLTLLTVVMVISSSSCFCSDISGTIYQKENDGASLDRAWVQILSLDRSQIIASAETNSEGKFTLLADELKDGTYIIRASKPGYNFYEAAATLKGSSELPFTATLSRTTLAPLIEYTHVPDSGSWGDPLRGIVKNIVPTEVKTITFILVRGNWWVKPYWAYPFTDIADDGTFSVNITTGGVDGEAVEYRTWLVTADYENDGRTWPPDPPTSQVLAVISTTR